MRTGIQTHFNARIDAETLSQLKALGYGLCRVDAQESTPALAAQMAQDVLDHQMVPLVIVKTVEQTVQLPEETQVEILNEPDLNGPTPDVYADLLWDFAIHAREDLQLWGPVISNLNTRGFAYLREVLATGDLPSRLHISIHRYGDNTFFTPHTGATSRHDEVSQLLTMTKNRPFGVSEFGYHQSPERKWYQWRARRLTDAQMAERIQQEYDFWAAHGAEFAVLYQLNDGPSTRLGDRYGIRRFDGSWKPSAGRR